MRSSRSGDPSSRRLYLLLGLVLAFDLIRAGTITKPNTFAAGGTIVASQMNDNFDTIYNEFNGSIDANNLAASAVETSELAALAVTYAKLAANIDTLRGQHSNLLVVGGFSDTGKVTVTCDSLALTDGTNWLKLHTVSKVLAPSNATIALLGQDTTFTVATGTNYYVYVISKADGTSSAVVSASSSSPNLTDATFAGYTYYRLVSAFLNEAAGSYDIREYRQVGGHVQLHDGDQVFTTGSTQTNQTDSLSPEVPTAVSTYINVVLVVTMGAALSANSLTVRTGSTSGPSLYFHGYAGTNSENNIAPAWFPSANGNIYWDSDIGAGAGTVSLEVVGFYIDQLMR